MEWPPIDAELVFAVTLWGEPVPAGSKNGFAARYKDGRGIWRIKVGRGVNGDERAFVTVTDTNNKRLKKRAEEVRDQVLPAMVAQGFHTPEANTPLAVEAVFYEPRIKGHYGTGRNADLLKASARQYPTKAPDTTKIWRGLEDSLTGLLWEDDSDVVDQRAGAYYVGKDDPYRTELRLWIMPDLFAGAEPEGEETDPEQINLLS